MFVDSFYKHLQNDDVLMNDSLDDVTQAYGSDRSGLGEARREGRRRGGTWIETNKARKERR